MKTIRQIRPDEWHLLKSLRLKALSDAPQAFSESLENIRQVPDSRWKILARQNSEGKDSICALALNDDDPIGMVVGLLDKVNRTKTHLVGMWVDPRFRGTGIAKGLLRFIVDWADVTGAKILNVSVTVENLRAQAFYQKLGFEFFKDKKALQPVSHKPKITMKKWLKTHETQDISEKRQYTRKGCHIGVSYNFGNRVFTDFIRNVSQGGIFIDTKLDIPAGQQIIVTYQPPMQGPVKRFGTVLWRNTEGMGVRLQ